jgi:pyruvate/2-oxoglutarate dehydrogenase complex dihydrolipoamide acyltransferase (E2) component
MVPITLPDLGTDNARLSGWLVEVGEAVQAGERVCEVRIPGATIGVLAPVDGRLLSRNASVNQQLQAGQTLGDIQPE